MQSVAVLAIVSQLAMEKQHRTSPTSCEEEQLSEVHMPDKGREIVSHPLPSPFSP